MTPEQEDRLAENAHFPCITEDLPGWLSHKNEDGKTGSIFTQSKNLDLKIIALMKLKFKNFDST